MHGLSNVKVEININYGTININKEENYATNNTN